MDHCTCLLVAVILFAISYFYTKWPYDYWKKQGIDCADSIVPIFGNTLSMLCFRESLGEVCKRLYKKSTASMVGMFHLNTPVLIIREPELVREVEVKQFNCFRNNLIGLDAHRDPFTSAHPSFAKDDKWKVSHTNFAKGMSSKKLKILFETLKRVSQKFENTLERTESEVDLKKLSLQFTSEMVCNAGFGIEYNQTYATMADKIFEYTWSNDFRHMFNFFLPNVAKLLRLNFEPEEIRRYFGAIAKGIVENEKGENFVRMTMETIGEINVKVATSLISGFYIEAAATVANVISATLFRLSKHPEIQEKLRNEINEVLDKNNGAFTYEILNEMSYLQQVINETMRLHPVIDINGKVCTEIATLHGSDGQTCTLKPGNIVILPIAELHKDERFWRHPEVFDPDRFSDERKDEVIKFAFLPFGEGPRQCIGMRYGTIEAKVGIITILRKYKLVSSDKTDFPLELDHRCVLRSVKGGLWANMIRI